MWLYSRLQLQKNFQFEVAIVDLIIGNFFCLQTASSF